METIADVVIVGGGVIGLTTAYQLALAGVRVVVLDKGAFGQEASWAGAGIIPPGNPTAAATPYDQLRGISSCLYPTLSAELRERTGIDNGYRVCGGVELFHDDPTAVLARWRQEDIPFTSLTAADLREQQPGLHTPAMPVWLPTMAQVRNPRHVQALVQACFALGVKLHSEQPVVGFDRQGERVLGARTTDGHTWHAGQVLLCAGAWGDELLGHFGMPVGIHPVRGQIVLFKLEQPSIRAVVCDDRNYLVPREDGRVLAGATEEPEAGFHKANTPEGVQGLIRFAHELVPVLNEAAVERTWSGLRPGTPDGLPYLGAIPGTTNAFVAGGHYRAGVQLSPGTGHVMADLLLGRPMTLDLHPFRLDRPLGPKVTPAFRS